MVIFLGHRDMRTECAKIRRRTLSICRLAMLLQNSVQMPTDCPIPARLVSNYLSKLLPVGICTNLPRNHRLPTICRTAATTRDVLGKYSRSSAAAQGSGVSGAANRTIGASR